MGTKQKINFIFSVGMAILLVTIAIFLLVSSKTVSSAVKSSVYLCLDTLIPSLYSFMILSGFIMSTQVLNPLLKPLYPLTRYLLKENSSSTAIIFLSMIAGYPIGAKLIAEQVKKGSLSLESAEHMLCYCVNAGPAFLISGVAAAKFSSLLIGIYIFLSHILSNLIIGFFINIRRKVPKKEKITSYHTSTESLSSALVRSVNGATISMSMICGMVILFSVLLSMLHSFGITDGLVELLQKIFENVPFEQIIPGILEVTQGCLGVESHQFTSIYIVAGLTAFGGICVHFQVIAMVHGTGIRLRKFFITRIWHVFNSTVICFFIIGLLNPEIAVFAPGEPVQIQRYSSSPLAACFLIASCVLLLLSCRKSDKIKSKNMEKQVKL